jgi:hypothetical protein
MDDIPRQHASTPNGQDRNLIAEKITKADRDACHDLFGKAEFTKEEYDMKNIPMVFILYIIFYSVNTMSNHHKSERPIYCSCAENTDQGTSKELQISLKTGKDTYAIGDEIHFTIDFKNVSRYPLRIFLDNEFVGSKIECSDYEGNKYTYEGGYNSWSPKAGIFTGRTYLIQPDSIMEIKLDVLVLDNYSLVFSNKFDRKGSNDFQDLKNSNNLPGNFPDKYISAGRIYKLPKAGKYDFTYVYQATETDKNWTFSEAKTHQEASTEFLWIGSVASNTIQLFIR